MQLGFAEILVVLVIALLVLGPERLPDAARKMGKAVSELKRLQDVVKHEFDSTMRDLERQRPPGYDDVQPAPAPPGEDGLGHPEPPAWEPEPEPEPASEPEASGADPEPEAPDGPA